MNRRNFLRQSSLGTLAFSSFSFSGITLLKRLGETQYFNIPMQTAVAQIRHGALALPDILNPNIVTQIGKLIHVDRNVFLKNDIHKNADDPEIISFFIQEDQQETFDVLQVLIDNQKLSFLYKGEAWSKNISDFPANNFMELIPSEHQSFKLYYGKLNGNDTINKTLENSKDIYIQSLEGIINADGVRVNTNISLGIKACRALRLSGEGKFLVLSF